MRILVAEDDPVSIRLLEATLSKWGDEVIVARNGIEALQVLRSEAAPPLALLDWMMPELDGVEVCRQIREEPTSRPVYIIMLTAKSRKEDVVEGLEAGADDYLTKPFDRNELRVRMQVGRRIVELQHSLSARVQELEAAIVERQRAEQALRNMTLTDELTGLYNRRGFFAFTEQSLKIARRMSKHALLFYADMDGLKKINDAYGHGEGSLAITAIASVLRLTFRESDIIARLGGDEFVVFANDVAAENVELITCRVLKNLQIYNAQGNHPYQLAISLGAVSVNPDNVSSIEELIETADHAMYEHKRSKSAARV